MKVETFSLADTIHITPAAANHFRRQLERSGSKGLRISLKQSGCSGYKYDMEQIAVPVDSDIRKGLDNGVDLYFDPADALALRGTEIDLTKEGLNQTLKFRNPNAVDACGCGESFNIDLASGSVAAE
jgi:iron-sulfur cluster assembly accessory protein